MKKVLIIGLILVAAIWLLVMPALVGLSLRERVPMWLEDGALPPQSEYRPGLFSSHLKLADGGLVQGRIQARHLPFPGSAWIDLTGTLTTGHHNDRLDLIGRFGVSGAMDLRLTSPELSFSDQPHIQTGQTRISLDRNRRGSTRVDLDLADLRLADAHGNDLTFTRAEGEIHWRQRGEAPASLAAQITLTGSRHGDLRLTFDAAPIDMQALSEMSSGIDQLRRARPDSLEQTLAMLTIGGAWQQLAAAGLTITVHEIGFDDRASFQGQWQTTNPQPEISGEGGIEALLDWFGPIIGLARSIDSQRAEQEARAWITALVDRDWMRVDASGFRFNYPGRNELENWPPYPVDQD